MVLEVFFTIIIIIIINQYHGLVPGVMMVARRI
jgi:hypothetical protein